MSVFRHLEDYLKERFASHPVSEIVSQVEADVKKLIDEAVAPLAGRLAEIEGMVAPGFFAKPTEPVQVQAPAQPAPLDEHTV